MTSRLTNEELLSGGRTVELDDGTTFTFRFERNPPIASGPGDGEGVRRKSLDYVISDVRHLANIAAEMHDLNVGNTQTAFFVLWHLYRYLDGVLQEVTIKFVDGEDGARKAIEQIRSNEQFQIERRCEREVS